MVWGAQHAVNLPSCASLASNLVDPQVLGTAPGERVVTHSGVQRPRLQRANAAAQPRIPSKPTGLVP